MTRRNKRWSELSRGQRTAIIAGAVVQLTLLALAQRDVTTRPASQIRGPKWMWRLLTLVNFIGPIAYFACGIRRDSASGAPADRVRHAA